MSRREVRMRNAAAVGFGPRCDYAVLNAPREVRMRNAAVAALCSRCRVSIAVAIRLEALPGVYYI